ncbi:DUF3267 domain-containing protein [Candidatus Chloroploca asiatica]|uniref:DUF3267 domain-containing protein n=1 Tax=Candidatus Chloroploca asiatica TaxID=1506545 RepID=UPI000BE8AB05|nr:DUF3267 domain-containing protein [Candidatus Chloroploca asiatica]
MMLYATAPGYAYQRDQDIVIALAPFVCISALVVLAMWAFAGTAWVPLLPASHAAIARRATSGSSCYCTPP